MNPCTGSEGQVAHQATNADERPASVKMFHKALTLRERLEIGMRRPVALSFTRKSTMPCCSGVFPVATVVHSRGDSAGDIVFMSPQAPCLLRRARFGRFPLAMS